ncbi:MAG: endo,4-beta-xylanase [Solirubrobacterales bacterium]|nr:endo,4-beta-xylanase [Solirubrobacterales bacterium]
MILVAPLPSASAAGLDLSGLTGSTASAPSTPVPVPPKLIPPRTTVDLGAAVWYACADDAYTGTVGLACQYRPAGPSLTKPYRDTWTRYFDRLTPENELKALWTEPKQGQFDFSVADKIVGLARAAHKHVRGHALVYAAANPGWIDKPLLIPWSRNTLLAAMQKHIRTEISHFQSVASGVIDEWDVVNEPFTGSGTRDQNVYQRVIGNDWIEQAFRTAHDQDPAAVLFLNEFNADTPGPRHDAVLALARDFVRRGVPLDGIGLEMHAGADGSYPAAKEIVRVMADFAELKLRVEVTELDALTPVSETAAGAKQRETYDAVADACRQSPNCTGVTVWGVADAYSWRTLPQHATLFDQSALDNGLFTAKRVAGAPSSTYSEVRCRLSHPWPTTADPGTDACAPTPATPPAIAVTTGPASGNSIESNPTPAGSDPPTG